MKYSPIRLQRALENTAKPLLFKNIGPEGDLLERNDPFGTGTGSIHVPTAADYLVRTASVSEEDLRFSVYYESAAGTVMKGVYMRSTYETLRSRRYVLQLVANRHDFSKPEGKAVVAKMELNIVLKSTEAWVKVPKGVVLMGGGRSFPIVVDPVDLEAGREHFAEISGWIMYAHIP